MLKRAKKNAIIIYNCIYIIQDTKRAQGPKARSKMAVTIKLTHPAAPKRKSVRAPQYEDETDVTARVDGIQNASVSANRILINIKY